MPDNGRVANVRTTGKYAHFSLPDFQNSYKVYELNEKTLGFKEAFFGTKKKKVDDDDLDSSEDEDKEEQDDS